MKSVTIAFRNGMTWTGDPKVAEITVTCNHRINLGVVGHGHKPDTVNHTLFATIVDGDTYLEGPIKMFATSNV